MTAALLLLAGCWTGAVPPDPPPPPVVVAPKPRRPPTPPRPPAQLALELASALRQQGPSLLATFVDGPVVVLDLDTAATSTLCGGAAIAAAQTWGAMLADPTRRPPTCYAAEGQRYFCHQNHGPTDPVVNLDFVRDDAGFRLVSAVSGIANSAVYSALRGKILELRTLADAATCP